MKENNSWSVTSSPSGMVFIYPPAEVDEAYDDLRLVVSGNLLRPEKIEIANKIADKLNNIFNTPTRRH